MSRNVPPTPSGGRRITSRTSLSRQFNNSTAANIPHHASPRSPDTASSSSTARAVPHPASKKKLERVCTVAVNESYPPGEVLLNLDILSEIKPGTLVSISHLKSEPEKASGPHGGPSRQQTFSGDHGAGAKPGSAREDDGGDSSKRRYVFTAKDMPKEKKARHPSTELYVPKHVADNFGMKKGTRVVLAPIDESNPVVQASHVELTFRDQYLARADLWRMTVHELTERTVYKGESILFLGTIKAQVSAVFVEGRRVNSAFFSRDTRPIFRSESAKYVLFIQMAREMWDFDSDGSGEIMFNKVVNGFLPALFKKWNLLKVRHLVTIVLFARVEYDAGLTDNIIYNTVTDYYTGRQPSGLRRPYKDFYRVVVNEMASVEWATILKQLKKEFNVFRRDISLNHIRPEVNFVSVALDANGNHIAPHRVKAVSSLAMYGNLIEAVNLAASQYAHDYIDRDLMRTGISIVVISPGPGVFEVDYESLRRTTESLVGNGIGIDIICVPKIPLHSVPLFKYRNPHLAQQKERFYHSRGSTPKRGSLVGSYQSNVGSVSPKGVELSHRDFNAVHSTDEWCYALPQWLHVSYWTGTSEDALSYQGIALSVNPGGEETDEEFTIRCRMYDLQMRSVLETNEIETAPLMSDPLFPSSAVIESGGTHRPRQTGTNEIAHIPNTRVPEGLFDHVYGFIKFAPDRMLKPGEKSLWKQLQEYDNSRAKLPKETSPYPYKSGRDLDDSSKRQLLVDPSVFATSLPENKPVIPTRIVSGNRKMSANLGESGRVGRDLLNPGRPPPRPAPPPPARVQTSPVKPQKLMRHISLGQRGFGIAAPKAAVAEVRIETVSASNSSRPSLPPSRGSEISTGRESLNRRPMSPRSITKRPPFSPDSLRLDLPDARATATSAGGIPSTPSIPIITKPNFSSLLPEAHTLKPEWSNTSPLARKSRTSEDRDAKFSSVLRAEDAQKVYNSKLRAGALPDLPTTLSPTSAVSPWLTVLNPSNPDANKVDDTMLFSRWQHVFPRTSKMKMMKWKALCCPAAVPLTTEYFPSRTQFENEYESKPYNIAQNDDEDVAEGDRNSREHFLRELISLRFSQGFQFVVGDAVKDAFGQKTLKIADIFARDQKLEDGASVFMSVGNTIHQLSCVNGSDVEVNIYSRKPPASTPHMLPLPSVYRPAIRTLLDSTYQTRELDIVSPRSERDWNYIDAYLAGHTDEMTEHLRFWRARFVLIPVDLRPSALPRMHDEDNAEEIRIEGIRRLAQHWQRYRYQTPSEQRFQSISRSKNKDPNPLDIVFKTEDPSVVIAAELETLPLIEGLEGIPRRGQLLSRKERFTKENLTMAALAESMQQPVESGGVRMQNRRWHLRMHYNCFIGSDMTTWLLDNVEDLKSREEAEALGKLLMASEDEGGLKGKEKEKDRGEGLKKERGSGLFVHVEKRHDFRDGQYFYQMSEEYAKPGVPAGWFSTRKRESTVPSTPSFDPAMRDSPRNTRSGSVRTESPLGSSSSTPTMTPAGGKHRDRPRVMLSKVIKYDVDPRGRSYRPERINLHYDRLHNPDACFHLRLEWMNVTAKLIEDAVETWAREVAPFGLRLVEVPIKEACTITNINPFKRPYLIHLAAPPPDKCPQAYVDPGSAMEQQTNKLFYQKAILRKFDFVLDYEAASNFPSDVDVRYSWGNPDFRYSQYIHRSGVLLAEITDAGDFLLMGNSLCNNRGTMHKDPKEAARYADTPTGNNGGRMMIGSYMPDSAVPPGSPLSRAGGHLGTSASPGLRPTAAAVTPAATATDPEGIKREIDAFCQDAEALERFYRETLEKETVVQTPVAEAGEWSSTSGVGPGGLEVVPEANIPVLGLPPGILRDGRDREGSPSRGAFAGQGLGVAAFRRRSVQDGIGLGGLQKM
ncbi:related to Vacuolar membrane-associated protein iml-1 [Cephalotrichum gorgonifer]|uniref:Vacuolar membrane-associated protein IML1 n=1 Tax=Cephalotrichum gorgonifer TaxID=2041049 RepID=A0AAE8MS62_9PEZI|nr:related to Vacuolar membrane-associated protein iml-1 [Cephalotrichum gorgonifer]